MLCFTLFFGKQNKKHNLSTNALLKLKYFEQGSQSEEKEMMQRSMRGKYKMTLLHKKSQWVTLAIWTSQDRPLSFGIAHRVEMEN